MSLPNDSILVTPGSGAQVPTHLVGSNEYQVVMVASLDGHILKSKNVYFYNIAEQVHVAAASTIHWDLFNADAALLVRVLSIRQRPSITTAVTGVAFSWTFQRTTAVGTGGVAQTAVLADLSQTALDADITCRSKPTGGATPGVLQESYSIHSEETNVGVIAIACCGGRELVPLVMSGFGYDDRGLILRQNQGLSVTQTFNSVAGNTGWQIVFTVE
jgi:hypothetical protein